MSKISYANLKLKTDTSVTIFDFNGIEIEVLNYLPIEKKYDLISIVLQKSKENGVYNPLKVDTLFHLYLVYMYTNLSFTDKQKEDEMKIYNCLKSNGFIDKLLINMKEEEYKELVGFLNEQMETELKFNSTVAGVINKVIEDLPLNAEAAMEIVENFDKEKFQQVLQFAQAANGGRLIG